MNEPSLITESRTCNTCTLWHTHCQAECCKLALFKVKFKEKPKKGKTIELTLKSISEDAKWYYQLRNFRVIQNTVFITLDEFKYRKETLYIYSTCNLLEYNLCKGHPFDKPIICKDLNLETAENNPDNYLTINCMYRYQLIARKNDGKNK